MKLDELKQFQAQLGIVTQTANKLGLQIMEDTLTQAMHMSIEYENLIRSCQAFVEKAGRGGELVESKTW